MNVGRLRKQLELYDDEDEVYVAIPTHNFWKNVMAVRLDHVGESDVAFSAYLNAKKVLGESYDRDESDVEPERVLLLAEDSTTVDV